MISFVHGFHKNTFQNFLAVNKNPNMVSWSPCHRRQQKQEKSRWVKKSKSWNTTAIVDVVQRNCHSLPRWNQMSWKMSNSLWSWSTQAETQLVKRWWWPEPACLVPSRWRWPGQLWGFRAMLRGRRVLANHNQEGPIGFPGSRVKKHLKRNVISHLDAEEEGQPISPVDLGWQSKIRRRRKLFVNFGS